MSKTYVQQSGFDKAVFGGSAVDCFGGVLELSGWVGELLGCVLNAL